MHSSLKFGLIASVMMVIPGIANAQLGGLGGLGNLVNEVTTPVTDTVNNLLGPETTTNVTVEEGVNVGVNTPEGNAGVCLGAGCAGGEAGGAQLNVPGVGDGNVCVGDACGNNALNLPVCVDALGNAILGCGDQPNPPPGPNPPPLPCLDALGLPILNCNTNPNLPGPPGPQGPAGPPGAPGGGGGAGGTGGGGGGNGGGGIGGGIAGNGVGANLDRTALGAVGDQAVCFYVGRNFQGTPYCIGRGAVLNSLGGWNNAIMSIRFITPGISVQVCDAENLGGTCTIVTGTLAQLFGGWERQISSLRVL